MPPDDKTGSGRPQLSAVVRIPGFAALRRTFIAHVTADVARLRPAIDGRDFTSIRRFAHDLKGTGAPYEFPELTELGRCLELAAQAGDARAVERSADELLAFLNRVKVG